MSIEIVGHYILLSQGIKGTIYSVISNVWSEY